MLKKIGIALGVVVVIFLLVVATRPSTFKIERSLVVAAPPAIVFAQVNDFNLWAAWSPWEAMDPTMKRTHSGAPSGVGAVYDWSGNDKVGEGRMTITESRPGEAVGIKLEFIKPMQATNDTVFTFKAEGEGTQVNWAMSGNNNFMAKAFSLFMNMDDMIGKDFEKGLASMKTVAEAEAKKAAEAAAAAAAAPPADPAAAPPAPAAPAAAEAPPKK